MQCPIDGAVLAMADRQGIEVDYCPTCRGVWLDRGELDKIIEREQAGERWDRSSNRWTRDAWDDDDRAGRGRSDDHERGGSRSKKRRSIFDAFDFD